MQWETTEQFQWGWQYNKVKYIKKKSPLDSAWNASQRGKLNMEEIRTPLRQIDEK